VARRYVVKRGDTLRKIAEALLGDGAPYLRIAEFNGLRDPDRVALVQRSSGGSAISGKCLKNVQSHLWDQIYVEFRPTSQNVTEIRIAPVDTASAVENVNEKKNRKKGS